MLKTTFKIKPLVLCILDGWGIANNYPGNAITQANPKNFNKLWFSYPHTYLQTSGSSVGLPAKKAGNSEVGHLNIGAGKVVFGDLMRINASIDNGTFYDNEALAQAIEHAQNNKSDIHIMGLLSSGIVHSSTNHLFAILELVKASHFPQQNVKIHFFTDGRDSPPTSAKAYMFEVLKKINAQNLGIVATISGRYFAMDRDNRWERTKEAYMTLLGKGQNKSYDPVGAIEISYTEGITDEFIKPTMIVNQNAEPKGPIKAGDSIIVFNFRPDRARQIVKAFVLDDFEKVKTASGDIVSTFDRGTKLQDLFVVTLTNYQSSLQVSAVSFEKEEIPMPIARVFSERGKRQFHIAETEKYAHVTYFLNGGKEMPFVGEDRLLVNSPKVASYDLKPDMSAPEMTKQLIKRIQSRVYEFIVVNFANADMLGHTGNLHAAVEAVKCIDLHLGILEKTVLAVGGALVITSDHGNAEQMLDPHGNIETQHNANPAPLIICTKEFKGKSIQLPQGILADVAPTILGLLNIPKPSQMTGRNLLE